MEAFSSLLQRFEAIGLLPSTREKYLEILRSMEEGEDPVTWLDDRVGPSVALGTVLPLRAAIKHYLIAEQGYSEEDLLGLLPEVQGHEAQHYEPLSLLELALYYEEVNKIEKEPARTILMLLPKVTLRIGELCHLAIDSLQEREGERVLVVTRRGEEHTLPLTTAAYKTLHQYFEEKQPRDWFFLGYEGKPITTHAIRKYTRRIAAACPELSGLCPDRLRATAEIA